MQQQEFDWLLNEEVNDILSQLHDIVLVCYQSLALHVWLRNSTLAMQECSRRFPVRLEGKVETLVRHEKFTLTATGAHNDHLKISTVLCGDTLSSTVSSFFTRAPF